MAEENDDGQEKTEEPSQRKIDKSREDGKVLTSKEMFIFTSIFTAMVLMFFSTMIFQTILGKWLSLFYFDYPRDLNKQIIEKFSDIIKLMIYPIIKRKTTKWPSNVRKQIVKSIEKIIAITGDCIPDTGSTCAA